MVPKVAGSSPVFHPKSKKAVSDGCLFLFVPEWVLRRWEERLRVLRQWADRLRVKRVMAARDPPVGGQVKDYALLPRANPNPSETPAPESANGAK